MPSSHSSTITATSSGYQPSSSHFFHNCSHLHTCYLRDERGWLLLNFFFFTSHTSLTLIIHPSLMVSTMLLSSWWWSFPSVVDISLLYYQGSVLMHSLHHIFVSSSSVTSIYTLICWSLSVRSCHVNLFSTQSIILVELVSNIVVTHLGLPWIWLPRFTWLGSTFSHSLEPVYSFVSRLICYLIKLGNRLFFGSISFLLMFIKLKAVSPPLKILHRVLHLWYLSV